jgi:hypothetical protein
MALVPRGRTRQTPSRQMPRRRLVWSRTRSVFVGVGTSGDAVDLLTTFRSAAEYGAQPIGVTVTRVRGRIILTETTATATNDFFGLGLVVEDRNSTVAEVPKPFADDHVDWLAWMPLARVGQDGLTGSFNSWEIDVRSQRKLDEVGQTLWLTMDAAVTSTWSATVVLSVLLKLP